MTTQEAISWYAYDFPNDRDLSELSLEEIDEWLDEHVDEYSPAKLLVRDRGVWDESKRLLIQWQEEDGDQTYLLYFPSFDAFTGTAENWTYGYPTPIRGRTTLHFVYCDTDTPEIEPDVAIGISAKFEDGDNYDFIIVSETNYQHE